MMKSKNTPQTLRRSRFPRALYPALSFVVILAWLSLKFQVDRLLHGSHEVVLYPLLIMAGFPDSWVIGAILGIVMIYAHILSLPEIPHETSYSMLPFISACVQILMLLYGIVSFNSAVLHLQSLSTDGHLYHLMRGDMNSMSGLMADGADIVMDCDAFGLICQEKQTFILKMCSPKNDHLALDPDTQALMLYVFQEAYAVTDDKEPSQDICKDVFRHMLERA